MISAARCLPAYNLRIQFDCDSAVHLRIGFISAVRGVLKLKPMGLATIGLPCGSFVWMNAATSKPSETRPFGDEDLPYIATANKFLGGIYCLRVRIHDYTVYANFRSAKDSSSSMLTVAPADCSPSIFPVGTAMVLQVGVPTVLSIREEDHIYSSPCEEGILVRDLTLHLQIPCKCLRLLVCLFEASFIVGFRSASKLDGQLWSLQLQAISCLQQLVPGSAKQGFVHMLCYSLIIIIIYFIVCSNVLYLTGIVYIYMYVCMYERIYIYILIISTITPIRVPCKFGYIII